MKENRLISLFYSLFLFFLPLTVIAQNNDSRIPVNKHTLNIVDWCDRIVMKAFQRVSRGKKLDIENTIPDTEEIELKYVEGSNGYLHQSIIEHGEEGIYEEVQCPL